MIIVRRSIPVLDECTHISQRSLQTSERAMKDRWIGRNELWYYNIPFVFNNLDILLLSNRDDKFRQSLMSSQKDAPEHRRCEQAQLPMNELTVMPRVGLDQSALTFNSFNLCVVRLSSTRKKKIKMEEENGFEFVDHEVGQDTRKEYSRGDIG